MNDEAEIQARLKQNLPKPYETDIAPTPEEDTTTGQATIAPEYELDELTMYKLHDYFGEQYKAHDEKAKHQLRYIYEQAAKMAENQDYGFVVSQISELERIIGIAHDERRRYKLYEWLKLNNVRKNVEAQMGALSG